MIVKKCRFSTRRTRNHLKILCHPVCNWLYGLASVSRIDKIIGLFCKRALQKRHCSAKETYNFVDPTYRSHPIYTNSLVHPKNLLPRITVIFVFPIHFHNFYRQDQKISQLLMSVPKHITTTLVYTNCSLFFTRITCNVYMNYMSSLHESHVLYM